jgi:hypothetical protein
LRIFAAHLNAVTTGDASVMFRWGKLGFSNNNIGLVLRNYSTLMLSQSIATLVGEQYGMIDRC